MAISSALSGGRVLLAAMTVLVMMLSLWLQSSDLILLLLLRKLCHSRGELRAPSPVPPPFLLRLGHSNTSSRAETSLDLSPSAHKLLNASQSINDKLPT